MNETTDKKPFWFDNRKTFLAKRLGEFFMITTAAVYASDFFAKFSLGIKIIILSTTLIAVIMGVVLTPDKGDEEGE